MKTVSSFIVAIITALLSGFEAIAQQDPKLKTDPGISVHNYKHTHKAKKAWKIHLLNRRFSPKVGITKRSNQTPFRRFRLQSTPKYSERGGWLFFRKTFAAPTRLNPLTNPNNYKTRQ